MWAAQSLQNTLHEENLSSVSHAAQRSPEMKMDTFGLGKLQCSVTMGRVGNGNGCDKRLVTMD